VKYIKSCQPLQPLPLGSFEYTFKVLSWLPSYAKGKLLNSFTCQILKKCSMNFNFELQDLRKYTPLHHWYYVLLYTFLLCRWVCLLKKRCRKDMETSVVENCFVKWKMIAIYVYLNKLCCCLPISTVTNYEQHLLETQKKH